MSETATRALSYVAMTRGRDTNTAYLYQRISEHDNRHATGEAPHVPQRATSHQAAIMLRAVVANDGYQMTAHGLAATAPHESLPHHVRGAMNQRKAAIRRRAMDYERWRTAAATFDNAVRKARGRDVGLDRSIADGFELWPSNWLRSAVDPRGTLLRPIQPRINAPTFQAPVAK